MKNNVLTDAERLFIHTAMFSEGIVPMEDPNMDVRRALEGLSEEDARKLKRKFRKLLRKQLKKQVDAQKPQAQKNVKKSLEAAYGRPGEAPSRSQKRVRKVLVHQVIMKEKVKPMIDQFKTIKREDK